MTLGRRIVQARDALGLSQTELAALIGSSQQAISKWEQGRSQPRPRDLALLAEALKVPPGELLSLALADAQDLSRVATQERDRLLQEIQKNSQRFEEVVRWLENLTAVQERQTQEIKSLREGLPPGPHQPPHS